MKKIIYSILFLSMAVFTVNGMDTKRDLSALREKTPVVNEEFVGNESAQQDGKFYLGSVEAIFNKDESIIAKEDRTGRAKKLIDSHEEMKFFKLYIFKNNKNGCKDVFANDGTKVFMSKCEECDPYEGVGIIRALRENVSVFISQVALIVGASEKKAKKNEENEDYFNAGDILRALWKNFVKKQVDNFGPKAKALIISQLKDFCSEMLVEVFPKVNKTRRELFFGKSVSTLWGNLQLMKNGYDLMQNDEEEEKEKKEDENGLMDEILDVFVAIVDGKVISINKVKAKLAELAKGLSESFAKSIDMPVFQKPVRRKVVAKKSVKKTRKKKKKKKGNRWSEDSLFDGFEDEVEEAEQRGGANFADGGGANFADDFNNLLNGYINDYSVNSGSEEEVSEEEVD